MFKIITSLLLLIPNLVCAQSPLEVHEWGTITSYHLPDGSPRPGVNRYQVAAEALPPFVHKLERESLRFVALSKSGGASRIDLTDSGHPDAIMRLETPVLYFHPPKEWDFSRKLSVSAKFNGGLLNEFFPNALHHQEKFGELAGSVRMTPESSSTLEWKDFQLLSLNGDLPKTDLNVWLAPRAINASSLKASTGEVEKYIFYRGVAALPSLIKTKHLSDGTVEVYVGQAWSQPSASEFLIPKAWMVKVNKDKKLAYHSLGEMPLKQGSTERLNRSYPLNDTYLYEVDHRLELRAEIKDQLLASGLYADEAEAMLNTWGDSYFGQEGPRILYIVPKPWIEAQLPLTISVPAKVTRVFVGRIEIE